MKSSLLTFIVCAVLALTSCKKEENQQYKLDVNKLTMNIGERHQFELKKDEKVYKVEDFNWRSTDMGIGNVNASAQVHAGKAGIATITVLLKEVEVARCEVTVKR